MPTTSAAFALANAPYNVFNVIAGIQTLGVTLRTGSKTAINPPRNVSRLEITNDATPAGILYITSDSTASATNKVGNALPTGSTRTWEGEGNYRGISMADKWFAPSVDAMIVHIDWE